MSYLPSPPRSPFLPPLVILFVLFQKSSVVSAWGRAGHSLTALIAEHIVSPETTDYLSSILLNETLSSVANWADSITHDEPWTQSLHFINVQGSPSSPCSASSPSSCVFDYSRDCADDICVAGAIANYTSRMSSPASAEDLYLSTKFLTHFVGDVHQPLHCARDVDRGGNTISPVKYTVTDQGDEFNLHQVWDFGIIENHLAAAYNSDLDLYADELVAMVGPGGEYASLVEEWLACPDGADKECTSKWGVESVETSLEFAYVNMEGEQIVAGDEIGEDYAKDRLSVVEQRLAMGGVRLAAILDKLAEA
ncbi:hypothetical protein TeGR_g2249 [Tetraparma gracilis]|uniref:Aspergillus nuclease S(1) n=1 Tax=Tetraparma gracilis TaxID=2962635 RepID=A0ABQ6N4Y3_9STRA|nr:hypothetical protein TeGR_g2249 [Tetraparma gracilis]